MKKIIIILAVLLTGTVTGFANDADSTSTHGGDTTKIKLGKTTLMFFDTDPNESNYDADFTECEEDEDDENWRAYLDVGVNGYLTPDNEITLPSENSLMDLDYNRSHSISFYSMHEGFDIIKNRLYMTAGLGLSIESYAFKNNVSISTSNEYTTFTADSAINYDKNKLRATYLQVPVVIGTRIGNLDGNPMSIQVGAIAGYNIRAKVKQKYTFNDTKYKNKFKDDYNLNPFKIDALARITIGDVGVYARYSVTSLFENGKAPELYPFSVGITFGEFKKLK